jgi:hypothetical protein
MRRSHAVRLLDRVIRPDLHRRAGFALRVQRNAIEIVGNHIVGVEHAVDGSGGMTWTAKSNACFDLHPATMVTPPLASGRVGAAVTLIDYALQNRPRKFAFRKPRGPCTRSVMSASGPGCVKTLVGLES